MKMTCSGKIRRGVCLTVALACWASVCLTGGIAGMLDDLSYANFFDRAGALLPGRTIIELDLHKDGEWSVEGGNLVEDADGIAAESEQRQLEFVWQGAFPPSRRLPVKLELLIKTDIPARIRFHVLSDGNFRRGGDWINVTPDAEKKTAVTIYTPPWRRYGDPDAGAFEGFKLVVDAKDLAGKTVAVQGAEFRVEYHEGFFRHEVEIPEGEIWEAVAEVGDCLELYVNGQLVEDESVILPRPVRPSGAGMYGSRRVSLKGYVRPGRNVLAIYRPLTPNAAPTAYMRGSVVMASGERILLDTGMDWSWSREAPENWYMPEYDTADWLEILDHADMPRSMGLSSWYTGVEAVSSAAGNFGLSYRPRGDRPCYDGLIKLRNPLDKKLYFNEDVSFRLEALIPPGFKDKNPELIWEIQRYSIEHLERKKHPSFGHTISDITESTFAIVAEGRITDFRRAFESLAGEINSVKLDRGIYVFTSRLLLNGEVIEERDPEAMVVTGKVKMPQKTAGDSWEQDMNLTLERVMDFTDPDDPHPWFETDNRGSIPRGRWGEKFYHTVEPALIVERNGLKYRETRPIIRSQFSYLIEEFAHPGDWYLMVLEYPDDDERWIGVSCNADSRTPVPSARQNPAEQYGACSKCGPTIWTGGKYPSTGEMLEMKWLYRPDPGSHSINVMSLMKDKPAAAARLRIYHVAGRLPELNVGDIPAAEQRRFGMVTERTYPWENGIYNLFSSFEKGEVSMRGDTGAGRFSRNPLVDICEHLRLLEDAASRYAEYMRFVGQNIHAMGCFQYSDSNTASQWITGDPRIHESSENMLGRVLAANDLMFYASVEFTSTDKLGKAYPPEWFFADREGNRDIRLWANKPLNLNFLHPEVESAMLEVVQQLARKFQHQPNFLGINWTTYFSGFWIPSYRNYTYPFNKDADSLDNCYDDLTISLFEKDTGIVVGSQKSEVRSQNEEDPDRYEQRYQFLTSPEMQPIWLAWRAQKMAEFFVKVNRVINEVRPGLETVAGCYFNTEHIGEWHYRNISMEDYVNKWGWDAAAFMDKDNIWLMPWLPVAGRYQPAYRSEGYPLSWQWNKSPDFYRLFAGLDRRAIMLHAGWEEVERIAANFPYREGWPRPYQQTMMGQQREEMAMEPYIQAMIGFDPQMVMNGFTDVSPYIGVEETQRKFARVLRRLPMGKFEPVLDTGFDTNFAIRALRQGDDYWFYVANPGYWPISGAVKLDNAEQVIELVSNQSVPMNNGAIKVSLEPFGIAAFRASPSADQGPRTKDQGLRTKDQGQLPTITSWSTEPVAGENLAHMLDIIARAEDAMSRSGNPAGFLGHVDYAILANTATMAQKALSEQRYAAAWSMLSDGPFWSVLFEKMPRMPDDILTPPELTIMRIGGGMTPVLDGFLNDLIWGGHSEMAGPFIGQDRQYAPVHTMVRMARAGMGLSFAFECMDPEPENIRATVTEHDMDELWSSGDDMVVITIMLDEKNACQFALNAAGTRAARFIGEKQGEEFKPPWKAAVRRHDRGWNAEMTINPREAFGRDNAEVKINFHRLYRMNQESPSSWVYTPDWQSTENMGILRLIPFQR